MRPEDKIADFLRKFDRSKTSPDDAARELLRLLEHEHFHLREIYDDDLPCPMCGGVE